MYPESITSYFGETIEDQSATTVLNNLLQGAGICHRLKKYKDKPNVIHLSYSFDLDGQSIEVEEQSSDLKTDEVKSRLALKVLNTYGDRLVERCRLRSKSRNTHENRDALLQSMRQQWPDVFNLESPLPLQIGVHKVLREKLDCSPSLISNVIRIWVNRSAYHRAILDYKHRFTLEGEPAEPITQRERDRSQRILANRVKTRERTQAQSEEQAFAKSLYNAWSKHWPDIFSKDNPKPLNESAVVPQLMSETSLPEDIIRTTLKWWMRRKEYKNAVENDRRRYSLNV